MTLSNPQIRADKDGSEYFRTQASHLFQNIFPATFCEGEDNHTVAALPSTTESPFSDLPEVSSPGGGQSCLRLVT